MNRLRIVGLLAGWVVPCLALAEPGLVAKYTDGKNTVETVVPAPRFALRENESVHPQIGKEFTAEYAGSIKVLRRTAYTFDGGGGNVLIDGKAVAGPIELDAGEHAIAIRYERKGPDAARLLPVWSSDQFLPEPIPATVLSHEGEPAGVARQVLIERGRTIVEEHNCTACHKPTGGQGLINRVGPDLTNVGARVTAAWIDKWMENPRHFRAGAVMPAMLTKAEDRRDAAAYLATLKDSRRRTGDLRSSESRAKQGQELFGSVGCANCHQGDLKLEGLGSKWVSIGQLAAYLRDPLKVDRSGRMPNMLLNEEESVALANYLIGSKNPAFEAALPEGADVTRGEQIVRGAGCVNCHTIDGPAGKALPDAKAFAALDQLDPVKGCLADNPPDTAPRYGLAADARQAVAAFVTSLKTSPLVSAAPAHQWQRSLRQFNCVACHETEFTKPEEGQEIVPPLTNVAAKLKHEWMSYVLRDYRARVRFWLKTRMPDFGQPVQGLADQAVAAAGMEAANNQPRSIPPSAVIAEGQKLVGANDPQQNPTGMGCVTCHSLREFKPAVAADATRGPELTLMSRRLRPDFFRRWMHEPARIQPGTAMPNFFTDKTRDQADHSIDVLWSYASLGVAMPPPRGVKERRSNVLIVTDTPIVSRCQVPDPNGLIVYGISVGLPGMTSYTFDAQKVMFRTAWQGGFLDMTGDWRDRGGNPVQVLGQRFYTQATPPIRIGSPDAADAPRVFKGYELKDKIPTFVYTVGGAEVRERITALPEGQGAGIVRTFEVDAGGKSVYFAATDEPNVVLSPSVGTFKPAQVRKTFKSPDKSAGQVLEIPAGDKVTFSVTTRAK